MSAYSKAYFKKAYYPKNKETNVWFDIHSESSNSDLCEMLSSECALECELILVRRKQCFTMKQLHNTLNSIMIDLKHKSLRTRNLPLKETVSGNVESSQMNRG